MKLASSFIYFKIDDDGGGGMTDQLKLDQLMCRPMCHSKRDDITDSNKNHSTINWKFSEKNSINFLITYCFHTMESIEGVIKHQCHNIHVYVPIKT